MQLEQVPNIVKLQLTVFLHAIKIYFKHDHDQHLLKSHDLFLCKHLELLFMKSMQIIWIAKL